MSMTPQEQQLLEVIRQHPKGANEETLTKELGWDVIEIVNLVNNLSEKGYVDFVTLGKSLFFRAKDVNEANRTRDLNQNEKIVYNFIKSEKSKGIWIKDLKTKSGLHLQVVTDCIKNLEKHRLIKFVKSVKNPTRKLYMLFDLTPSEDLTGGAWYTDQELDVAFIEGLTEMSFKLISSKSYPKPGANADKTADTTEYIYPPDHQSYASTRDVHTFLKRSGALKVELTMTDVQSLVDRLWYDGKITRIRKMGGGGGEGGNHSMSEEDDFEDEEEVVDVWMYRAVKGESVSGVVGGAGGVWWTDVPCGKCAVRGFCKTGGPVSPEGCVYFNKWLEF
ncbi:34-kDa subunit of RNA polymerase III (C) [Podochytrium sp. JEL0797]|nr:34-kDa subunit of RNA polymerase III (C) [Podochytrium sp. JEL0797]